MEENKKQLDSFEKDLSHAGNSSISNLNRRTDEFDSSKSIANISKDEKDSSNAAITVIDISNISINLLASNART